MSDVARRIVAFEAAMRDSAEAAVRHRADHHRAIEEARVALTAAHRPVPPTVVLAPAPTAADLKFERVRAAAIARQAAEKAAADQAAAARAAEAAGIDAAVRMILDSRRLADHR